MVFLTHGQFAALLGAVPERWQPLVLTLAGTGMRWSEATALPVSAFDLASQTVRVTRAWKRTAGRVGARPAEDAPVTAEHRAP